MRLLMVLALTALVAGPAGAQLLGATAPPKDAPGPPPNLHGSRQGGDTIYNAVVIPSYPYSTTGTTLGYLDDYDAVCPYDGSTSPDVVYSYTSPNDEWVAIDLCGSSYDTKVYVLDEGLNVVACNDDYYFDDFCGVYVSFIEQVQFEAGVTYYIVVDGYGGDAGDYMLYVGSTWDCWIDCPPGGIVEGEPPLQNDQDDFFNCGCGCEDFVIRIQSLPGDQNGEHLLCGRSGWFTLNGLEFRDTDWFSVVAGPQGTVQAIFEAERSSFLFHLAPADCQDVAVADQVQSNCTQEYLAVTATPEEVVWLWVGPTTFVPPYGPTPFEFDYVLELSGLAQTVAVDATSWSQVKALYH